MRCVVQDGSSEDAKECIKRGANVDWRDGRGYTPLHEASERGNTEMTMLLIQHRASLNIVNRWGNTPLMCAAFKNNMAAVCELVWSLCKLDIRNSEGKKADEQANFNKGTGPITEYLTKEALREQVRQTHRARALGATRLVSPCLLRMPWKYLCCNCPFQCGNILTLLLPCPCLYRTI